MNPLSPENPRDYLKKEREHVLRDVIAETLERFLGEYFNRELVNGWLGMLNEEKLELLYTDIRNREINTTAQKTGLVSLYRDSDMVGLQQSCWSLILFIIETAEFYSRETVIPDFKKVLNVLTQMKGEDIITYTQWVTLISSVRFSCPLHLPKLRQPFQPGFLSLLGTPQFGELLTSLSKLQTNEIFIVDNSIGALIFLSIFPNFEKEWLGSNTLTSTSWDKRLINLDKILQYLGIDHVSEEEVIQVITSVWAPQSEKERIIQANFNSLPVQDQQYWIHRLRNNMSLLDERIVRSHIRFQKELQGVLPDNSKENEIVRYHEHPLHPVNQHFFPTVGYEIESAYPEKYPPLLYTILMVLGFTLGAGGSGASLETSPPPAFHPETLITVITRWLDAGLLDIHRGRHQTLHYNVGTHSGYLTAPIDRLLMATHWAYRPRYDEYDENHTLGIYYNRQPEGEPYIETKGFILQTPDLLKQHFYHGSHLNVLVLALERAVILWLEQTNQKDKIRHIGKSKQASSGFINPSNVTEFDMAALEFSSFSRGKQRKYISQLGAQDQYFISLFWQMNDLLKRGYSKAGIPNWQGVTVPLEQMNIFSTVSRDIFPDASYQYDPTRVKKEHRGFYINNTYYPNFIDFSRQVAIQVGDKVAQLLTKTENGIYAHLGHIRSHLHKSEVVETFYRSYPWLLPPETAIYRDKTQRIEELIAFAKEFGKL